MSNVSNVSNCFFLGKALPFLSWGDKMGGLTPGRVRIGLSAIPNIENKRVSVTFQATPEVALLLESLPDTANRTAVINQALLHGLPVVLQQNVKELRQALDRLRGREHNGRNTV